MAGQLPGLPMPEVITLSQVKTPSNADWFDPNRTTGGEYYQGRLVRIEGVHVVSGTWGLGGALVVGDATGLTLPVMLGVSMVSRSLPI